MVAVLLLTLIVGWWLSRYDTAVTGRDKATDFKRRGLRVGVTLILVALGAGGGFILVAIAVPLGLLWVECLTEFGSRGLLKLIDSDDYRPAADASGSQRLDEVARLVQAGQDDQAIELCTKLLAAGEASAVAMEAMLSWLYGRMFDQSANPKAGPLAEVRELCARKLFAEAESRLEPLFTTPPSNLHSVVMLLRICVQDVQRPARAYAYLDAIERNSRVPPGFVPFARDSIRRWLGTTPAGTTDLEGIESLLVRKRL